MQNSRGRDAYFPAVELLALSNHKPVWLEWLTAEDFTALQSHEVRKLRQKIGLASPLHCLSVSISYGAS